MTRYNSHPNVRNNGRVLLAMAAAVVYAIAGADATVAIGGGIASLVSLPPSIILTVLAGVYALGFFALLVVSVVFIRRG